MWPFRSAFRSRKLVFVSYRRSDTGEFAQFLYGRLRDRLSARVFLDTKTLIGGKLFSPEITKALDECSVFLALIGPNWNIGNRLNDPEDLVRREIAHALSRQSTHVIPVLINIASLPNPTTLPESIRALVQRQAFTISTDNTDADVDNLTGLVESYLKKDRIEALDDALESQRYGPWYYAETGVLASVSVKQTFARCQNYSLLGIDDSVLFGRFPEGNPNQTIRVRMDSFRPSLEELHNPTRVDLLNQINAGYGEVAEYLKPRAEATTIPGFFQCKVGLRHAELPQNERFNQPMILTVAPLSYWVVQEFNRRILTATEDRELARLYKQALDEIFALRADTGFYLNCPSALFLEVILCTADGKIALCRKSPRFSVLARVGFSWTATLEEGLVWRENMNEEYLDLDSVLANALQKELGINVENVTNWGLLGLALEHTHLNSAILAFAKLSISSDDLISSIKGSEDFDDYDFMDVSGAQNSMLQRNYDWHPTARLRVLLLTRMMKARGGL
jgi:hypothetical protein